jgi:haloacetate dehalogenase
MFEGFSKEQIQVDAARIHARVGGKGPPVLLLHGFPQTHVTWRRVAPVLARDFTVVVTDLRGYGDSSIPDSDPSHRAYSKRRMAIDQIGVMRQLGFEKFAVVGHDRGARVAYRMAFDHPETVTRVGVLDIIPTWEMWQRVDEAVALAAYHWFFLAQPAELVEPLLTAGSDAFLRHTFRRWAGRDGAIDDEAYLEFARCFRPENVHAMCEDYRAGATIDEADDAADKKAGKKIECPLLALWSEIGMDGQEWDVLAIWREWANTTCPRKRPTRSSTRSPRSWPRLDTLPCRAIRAVEPIARRGRKKPA